MSDTVIWSLAVRLGQAFCERQWRLALAESCTGGGIAVAVTDVPGSSAWFDRGFVSYSNAAKVDMLGVEQSTLDSVGAVSEAIALEMAAGALSRSQADFAMAVTGIAGPDGGSEEKPVGTVFIAWQRRGQPGECVRQRFDGDRLAVRLQVVEFCLRRALDEVTAQP